MDSFVEEREEEEEEGLLIIDTTDDHDDEEEDLVLDEDHEGDNDERDAGDEETDVEQAAHLRQRRLKRKGNVTMKRKRKKPKSSTAELMDRKVVSVPRNLTIGRQFKQQRRNKKGTDDSSTAEEMASVSSMKNVDAVIGVDVLKQKSTNNVDITSANQHSTVSGISECQMSPSNVQVIDDTPFGINAPENSTVEETTQSESEVIIIPEIEYADLVQPENDESDDFSFDTDVDDDAFHKPIQAEVIETSQHQLWDPKLTDFEKVVDGLSHLHQTLNTDLEGTDWIVDHSDDQCRISMLGPDTNAVVERSVCWKSGVINIFINNKSVPRNSFLWQSSFLEDNVQEIRALANIMTKLAFALSSLNICTGVTGNEIYWDTEAKIEHGCIEPDIYQGTKCYRPPDCVLTTTNSGMCPACLNKHRLFSKRIWKSTNRKGQDQTKTNYKHRSLEEMSKQLVNDKILKKAQKRKLKKMEIKIQKLITRDNIMIDSHLGNDFTKILRDNAHKMTDIQKLFWQEQLKAVSRQNNPKNMEWSPMTIKIALHLQSISASALEYVNQAGFLRLPSQRTLFDFSHFTKAHEGVQHEIISLIEKKFKENTGITEDQKYFNLLHDEMTIKQDIVINKYGEMIGYVNLTDVEKTLENLENNLSEKKKRNIAKKVLVFMLQGITSQLSEVVGIFSTIDVTAAQLYTRTWEVIYQLESAGFKILTIICDGAAANKKFFKMHTPLDSTQKVVYVTKNLASGTDRPLFFMVDPPHLVKTLRNCLSNSYGHSHSREMWKNGQKLSWAAIEKLYEVTLQDQMKTHKLSKAHIKLTAFSRMKCNLAFQVLSKSVANSLKEFKEDPRFDGLVTEELLSFLRICNRMIDCLNGSADPQGKRNKLNDDLNSYQSVNDPRFDFLKRDVLGYFEAWKQSVTQRPGTFSAEQRRRMLISEHSLESIQITILGFCGAVQFLLNAGAASVDGHKFNQDKLEQEFGIYRMGDGANNHPTLARFIQKCLSNYAQRSAALPPLKGNTSRKRAPLTVNQEPLPRRPKPQ